MNREHFGRAASLFLVATLLLSAIGGVAMAATWQAQTVDQDNLVILEDTQTDQAYDYNVTANASSVSIDTGTDIILTSNKNISAINGSSVALSGSGVANLVTDWTYNDSIDVWYQTYNVTTVGDITFEVTNGTLVGLSSTNTTIDTSETRGPVPLAGVEAVTTSAGTNVDPIEPGNAQDNVSFQIVEQLYEPDSVWTSNVDNAVEVTGDNVNVSPTAGTLTREVVVNVTGTYNNSMTTFTVVINDTFAPSTAVEFQNITNAQHTSTESSYNGVRSLEAYHFDVLNATQTASVEVVMDVSQYNASESFANATWTVVDYNAEVVGETHTTSPQWDVTFQTVGAGAGFEGAQILPLPNFIENLGTAGQVLGWIMVLWSIVGTGFAAFLVFDKIQTGSMERLGGYVVLPALAIFSLSGVVKWFLPVFFVLITLVDIYLYQQSQTASTTSSQPVEYVR